jgi:hypothetical protein
MEENLKVMVSFIMEMEMFIKDYSKITKKAEKESFF